MNSCYCTHGSTLQLLHQKPNINYATSSILHCPDRKHSNKLILPIKSWSLCFETEREGITVKAVKNAKKNSDE